MKPTSQVHTQSRFSQWLRDNRAQFEALPPFRSKQINLDKWLACLRDAAIGSDISPHFQQLNLDLPTLSQLLEASTTASTGADLTLLQTMLQAQNRVVSAFSQQTTPAAIIAPTIEGPDDFPMPPGMPSYLEWSRLMQQRLAEVSAIYTLAQEMTSTLDLDMLLTHLVDTIRQVVDCRACVLFLLDNDGKRLEIRAASGLKTHWRRTASLAVGEGAAGKAVQHKQTVYIRNTSLDPSYIVFDPAVMSIIVVPLLIQDRVIGTINLDDTAPNAFGPEQERLLSIAASQAAIAIENARLFEQVRSEEQQTRAIIDHMADGLLVLNRAGDILRVNATLLRFLDLSIEQIVGQNIFHNQLPHALAAITKHSTLKPQPPARSSQEIVFSTPQKRILRLTPTILTNPQHTPIGEVLVVHDVTQERELEQFKDDLIATVSHELRTPLFSIQGFISLILDQEVTDQAQQRKFLKIIQRQTYQLTNLVNNLLDMNKLSAGLLELHTEFIQIDDIIEQVLMKLEGFAQNKKVDLVFQQTRPLPSIMGDAQRLEQIITNLVGNAIKFTPANGNVHVTTSVTPTRVIIKISDTGIGIPEADLPHIFGKFYQVAASQKRQAQGTGLGLHISKQLIEHHGGEIRVESHPGQGSTFFVALPRPKSDIPFTQT